MGSADEIAMPVSELIVEALRLMGIGMGIVFAFLLLLVGVLRLMSAAVARYAPPPPALVSDAGRGGADAAADGELVAVISAAIARYRRARTRGGR
jgi:oxaloacetate decarboxylase gamma subunit